MGPEAQKEPRVKDHNRDRYPTISEVISRASDAIPEQDRRVRRIDIRFDAGGNGTVRLFVARDEEPEVVGVA